MSKASPPASRPPWASPALGQAGEEAAAAFLLRQGWRILERNWRPPGAHHGLELDIIAMHGNTLVFVEVKSRSAKEARPAAPGARFSWEVPPYASFTPQKQRNVVRAARHYLTQRSLWNLPCRFDLVCMERRADKRFEPEHFVNVIELGQTLDSGNAPWQPW